MAKFDYMEFYGGYQREIAFHAKKFTKEEALSIAKDELEYFKLEDLVASKNHVRYYPKTPESLVWEIGPDGCYSYCNEGERGSFPVWVVHPVE